MKVYLNYYNQSIWLFIWLGLLVFPSTNRQLSKKCTQFFFLIITNPNNKKKSLFSLKVSFFLDGFYDWTFSTRSMKKFRDIWLYWITHHLHRQRFNMVYWQCISIANQQFLCMLLLVDLSASFAKKKYIYYTPSNEMRNIF